MISIGVSIINIVVFIVVSYKNSIYHGGMSFLEYIFTVLQLNEIPLKKFIPKLPGIKNGTVKHVNFSLLKLDVDSIGCLIDTFTNKYNTKSRNLRSITISLGSLVNLSNELCQLFGNFLKNNNVQIKISNFVDCDQLYTLFSKLYSNEHNRRNRIFINKYEFVEGTLILNASLNNMNNETKLELYKSMAIRHLKLRHKVYFYDVLHSTVDIDRDSQTAYKNTLNLCQLDPPIHGVIYQIQSIIASIKQARLNVTNANSLEQNKTSSSNNNKKQQKAQQGNRSKGNNNNTSGNNNGNDNNNEVTHFTYEQIAAHIKGLRKIYYVCKGSNKLFEIDRHNGLHNHILFAVADALSSLDLLYVTGLGNNEQDARLISSFLDEITDNILFDNVDITGKVDSHSKEMTLKLINTRNKLFEIDNGSVLQKQIEYGLNNDYIVDISNKFICGMNIFEYCVAFGKNGDASTDVSENRRQSSSQSIFNPKTGHLNRFTNQTKLFTKLLHHYLNSYPKMMKYHTLKDFNREGPLFHVYTLMNGFYATDVYGNMVLDYAISYQYDNVIAFYFKFIFNQFEDDYTMFFINNPILMKRYAIDLLKCDKIFKEYYLTQLLSYNQNICNYMEEPHHVHLANMHHEQYPRAGNDTSLVKHVIQQRIEKLAIETDFKSIHKRGKLRRNKYLLECIEILSKNGCNFALSGENGLYDAISANDLELCELILKLCYKRYNDTKKHLVHDTSWVHNNNNHNNNNYHSIRGQSINRRGNQTNDVLSGASMLQTMFNDKTKNIHKLFDEHKMNALDKLKRGRGGSNVMKRTSIAGGSSGSTNMDAITSISTIGSIELNGLSRSPSDLLNSEEHHDLIIRHTIYQLLLLVPQFKKSPLRDVWKRLLHTLHKLKVLGKDKTAPLPQVIEMLHGSKYLIMFERVELMVLCTDLTLIWEKLHEIETKFYYIKTNKTSFLFPNIDFVTKMIVTIASFTQTSPKTKNIHILNKGRTVITNRFLPIGHGTNEDGLLKPCKILESCHSSPISSIKFSCNDSSSGSSSINGDYLLTLGLLDHKLIIWNYKFKHRASTITHSEIHIKKHYTIDLLPEIVSAGGLDVTQDGTFIAISQNCGSHTHLNNIIEIYGITNEYNKAYRRQTLAKHTNSIKNIHFYTKEIAMPKQQRLQQKLHNKKTTTTRKHGKSTHNKHEEEEEEKAEDIGLVITRSQTRDCKGTILEPIKNKYHNIVSSSNDGSCILWNIAGKMPLSVMSQTNEQINWVTSTVFDKNKIIFACVTHQGNLYLFFETYVIFIPVKKKNKTKYNKLSIYNRNRNLNLFCCNC